MKKRLNIIFFSICFLAALLAESYCIQVLKEDLFSVIGIGVVVLITGYLFMDSIRSMLLHSRESAKFYMDRIYREESEKWNERYTEIVNLQKATYTATKKNTAMVAEQLTELQTRLETLEGNNTKALQKISELQKKSLEGQKNALNLEINYNKENTKSLITVLREEGSRNDQSEQLSMIISLLERNNLLLNGRRNIIENTDFGFDSETEAGQVSGYAEDYFKTEEDTFTEDFYEELDTVDHIEDNEPQEENASEPTWSLEEEPEPEAVNTYSEVEETIKPTVIPLYEDPNKALTADEIASLFASFGK